MKKNELKKKDPPEENGIAQHPLSQTLLRPEPVSILILSGPELRIKMANQTFLKLTKNAESKILNKPFFDIYPLVRNKFESIIQNVLQSGISYYGEELGVPISFNQIEKVFYLDIILHPMPSDRGKPDTIMVVILDATAEVEMKRASAEKDNRIKKMIQESRVCMLLLRGDDFIIEYGNDRMFNDILSIKPGDALGKPLLILLPELEKQGFRERLNRVFHDGQIVYEDEVSTKIRLPEGEKEFFFNYEIAPLRNEQDKVTAVMVSMNDITEQVTSRLLQERNQHMVEQSLDSDGLALWELDLTTKELTYAPRLAELVDLENKAAGFDALLEHVYPADRKNFRNTMQKGIEKGEYSFEGRFFTKTKSLAWLRIHGKVFYDSSGNPAKLVGSTSDITHEKKERLELERKEQRLKNLIYQAPVAIGILRGPDHKVEIINAAAIKLLGRTENEIKGKSFTKVMNEIDTDEAQRLLDLVYNKNEVITANEYPIKFLRNGVPEKVYVNFECHPTLNNKGRAIGIMVVGYEVTNLVLNRKKIEESESRFRLLAESTRNFVSSLDKNQKMTYANKTFTRFTGYSVEELNRKGFASIIHPDDFEKAEKKWETTIKKGSPYIVEQRIRNKDGSYHWFLSTAVAETDSSGNILGWIFNSTDIQEIKEQELQKDFFISRASHELKTPMTSIKGYIQILKLIHEDAKDENLLYSLDKMDLQVNKLTHLIDDLLDTTRISKDGLKINFKKCSLPDLIRSTIEEVRISSEREVEFRCDERRQMYIMADQEKLGQVISNLLTNAIKYSPGGDKVQIKTKADKDQVLVSITDKGIGIPASAQKKIFEKFYRVSGKNEETFPGLGIGLYIANEILKRHGSHIAVKSRPGNGSTFYFKLKLLSGDKPK